MLKTAIAVAKDPKQTDFLMQSRDQLRALEGQLRAAGQSTALGGHLQGMILAGDIVDALARCLSDERQSRAAVAMRTMQRQAIDCAAAVFKTTQISNSTRTQLLSAQLSSCAHFLAKPPAR